MDDEVELREIEAAGGDVRGDEDAGAAVAEGLQGARALVLGELAGQRDRGEAALDEAGVEVADAVARGAETSAVGGFMKRIRLTTTCSRSRGDTTTARCSMSTCCSFASVAATRSASFW